MRTLKLALSVCLGMLLTAAFAQSATTLRFEKSPTWVLPGQTFPVVVRVENADGSLDAGAVGKVVLSIKTGSGAVGARLSGTTIGIAIAGRASFSGVSVDLCGPATVLTAASLGLPPADSEPFDVSTISGPTTERISLNSAGAQGNGYSRGPSISADGRFVAFYSRASNLSPDVTDGALGIFVRDRKTGQTERVSITSLAPIGGEDSLAPCISADGRFVVFQSWTSDLVPGDTNMNSDIFVHDRLTRTTERVSVDSSGAEADSRSDQPSISADGRFVAFMSFATNLVAEDTNDRADVFVRDRLTGTTQRVSVTAAGTQNQIHSQAPSISADGRYVAYESFTTGPCGPVDWSAVYLYDRQTGTTEMASMNTNGIAPNVICTQPSISADGKYIAFSTYAPYYNPDIVSGQNIYLRDRRTGLTELVSVNDSVEPTGSSRADSCISADGRYVAYRSSWSTQADGYTARYQVYLRDRERGVTERVSVNYSGTPANQNAYLPTISADGGVVAFASIATNLVWGDSNGKDDVFVRDRIGGRHPLAFSTQPGGAAIGYPLAAQPVVVLRDVCGEPALAGSETVTVRLLPGFGTAGAVLTGTTTVPLVDGAAVFTDIGVSKTGTGFVLSARCGTHAPVDSVSFDVGLIPNRLEVATQPIGGLPGGPFQRQPVVRVTDEFGNLDTWYTGPVALSIKPGTGKTGAMLTGTTTVDAVAGVATFTDLRIDICGLGYVIVAMSGNLTPGESEPLDVKSAPGTTERVSVTDPSVDMVDGESFGPALNGDGTVVAFYSAATTMVPDDNNWMNDVFVRDRPAGRTERVSVASDGSEGDGDSDNPAVSADGRFVAFRSAASNLVPGDTNGLRDIFVHDRLTGQTERVSVDSAGAQADGESDRPCISADGRFVAYQSLARNLAADDENEVRDIYVRDRQAGRTERVSLEIIGTNPYRGSTAPSMSADGRFVTFIACYHNTEHFYAYDETTVAVHDRQTGLMERIFTRQYTFGNYDELYRPVISADGRFVAFEAEYNPPGNWNEKIGIFVFDRQTGQTESISDSQSVNSLPHDSWRPSISADGRYVAFDSTDPDLAPDDTNTLRDVFVYDRQTGRTEIVSRDSFGAQANGDSRNATISGDGRFVAFWSLASFLVSDENNGMGDVFVVDRVFGGIPPAFATQPSGATAGLPMAVQPIVVLRDKCGDPYVGYSADVTLSIKPGTGTPGAALIGTTTVALTGGYAVFSGVGVDKPGTGYVLTAACGPLASVDSLPFDVGPINFSMTDVVDVLRWASGLSRIPKGALQRFDVDADGRITLADATWICRTVAQGR